MGCFSSKESSGVRAAAPATTVPSAAVASEKVEVGSPVPPPVRRAEDVSELDRAMLSLKSHRDRLERTLNLSEAQCEADLERAVELNIAGRKERALMIMRRRKLAQARAADAVKGLTDVETLMSAVDTQQNAGRLLETMKQGSAALEAFSKVVNVQTMEAAAREYREKSDETQEIQEVLDSAFESGYEEPPEDELRAEIDEILRANTKKEDGNMNVSESETTPEKREGGDTLEALSKVDATPSDVPEMPEATDSVDETNEDQQQSSGKKARGKVPAMA